MRLEQAHVTVTGVLFQLVVGVKDIGVLVEIAAVRALVQVGGGCCDHCSEARRAVLTGSTSISDTIALKLLRAGVRLEQTSVVTLLSRACMVTSILTAPVLMLLGLIIRGDPINLGALKRASVLLEVAIRDESLLDRELNITVERLR